MGTVAMNTTMKRNNSIGTVAAVSKTNKNDPKHSNALS